MYRKKFLGVFSFVLWLLLCLYLAVIAQDIPDENITTFKPVTAFDLGISKLSVEIGETYTFHVTMTPADSPAGALKWYADDTIVRVDPYEYTVTAIAPGTTRILVESYDGALWAVCDIDVKGNQTRNLGDIKTGVSLLSYSSEGKNKIKAKSVLRYLDFIESGSFSSQAFDQIMQRIFRVTADVKPGSEADESNRALALGMEKANPLPDLNGVTLRGTLEQLLAFSENNENLIRIIEFPVFQYIQPVEDSDENEDNGQKAVNLDDGFGYVEKQTSISVAHDLGLTGAGTAVAVVDTGIDRNHEQFAGRVVAEACFTLEEKYADGSFLNPVCYEWSSEPSRALKEPDELNHGSNVTGIAAGRDGIAPDARIVSVNNAYQYCVPYYQGSSYYTCSVSPNMSELGDIYQYLLDKQKEFKKNGYPLISAVNLSEGLTLIDSSTGYAKGWDSFCDSDDDSIYVLKKYLDKLGEAGMVPVFSSGNNGFDGAVAYPACLSNAYSVGALDSTYYKEFEIEYFSNHSDYTKNGRYLLDIVAPGHRIYSAAYYTDGYYGQYCKMSGTSQAAPMVTGGMAILQQAFPLRTVEEYEAMLRNISNKTVTKRDKGCVQYGDYGHCDIYIEEKTFTPKKILNFEDIASYLHIANRWVIGYSGGILIKIPVSPLNRDLAEYLVTVTDVNTNKKIFSNRTIYKTIDPTGKYWKLAIEDPNLVPGNVYKIAVTQLIYKTDGTIAVSNSVTKYGTPMRSVSGPSASPKDKAAAINSKPVSYSDGTRYIIRETNGTLVDSKYVDGTASGLWNKSGLKNGRIYHLIVNPYIKYKSTYLWGPTVYNIYFVPLSAPSNANVTWSNSTTAKISVTADSAANGIRVLYRETGGAIVNGCESTGSSCSVKKLDQSGSYEFYVMKYKNSPSGKRHYGPGTLVTSNATPSGLPAPESPIIQQSGNKFTVTITKDSAANGISVLYRQNEGKFQLLCEADSNTCNKTLSVNVSSNYYTFYVMQYTLVNGKKVYSPGTISKNLLSPKSADLPEIVSSADDDVISIEEIYNILPDYVNESEVMQEDFLMALAEEEVLEDYIRCPPQL